MFTSESRKAARVLLIGLDAAEPSLIERWTEDGSLPNLRRLRESGAYGRLQPPKGLLMPPPWPTFYTGTSVAEHGLYGWLVWDAERMIEVRPAPEALPLRPFWRRLDPEGPRVIAIDIPLVYHPEPFDGLEIVGWSTHERLGGPSVYPAELEGWIHEAVGPSPYVEELHRRLPLRRLLEERDDLVRGTRWVVDLASRLLRERPWDLALCGISSTHRAGHKLWSEAGSDGRGSAEERAAFADALRDVYVAADEAVGRLLEAAGPQAAVIVFALHGMGPNGALLEVLPEMLERVLAEEDEASPRKAGASLLRRARQATPLALRGELKRRLPHRLQHRLSSFWRTSGLDWDRTKAFCLTANVHGFIRLNVKGREARGIVEPGPEYEALCERIADGLRSFVDADSGEAVVERIVRRDQHHPLGSRADRFPDLTVVWACTPTSERREIRSDRLGTISLPEPGWHPDGRSGNHRFEGWALAGGPGTEQVSIEGGTILDLAPTALQLLGLAPLPEMEGKPLMRNGRRPGAAGSAAPG